MAESIVHNHTPKSETEEQGLFDRFRKKDVDNEDKTDSSSCLSDKEEKTEDKTMKEKIEEKIEEDKIRMNVKIIQGTETALNLKQKIGQQFGSKEASDQNEEPKVIHEKVVMQPVESSYEPEDKVHSGNAENEHQEKKGIFEKIKEKIPGYSSKSEEEIKKEKECDKE